MSKLYVSPDVFDAMKRAVIGYVGEFEDQPDNVVGVEILRRTTPLNQDECEFIMNAASPIPVEVVWNRRNWAELQTRDSLAYHYGLRIEEELSGPIE